jgi:hypothetical protein
MSTTKRVEKAIARDPQRPKVKVGRGFDGVIEVETAMEGRGYIFTAWESPKVAVYRYDPEALAKQAASKRAALESVTAPLLSYLFTDSSGSVRREIDSTSFFIGTDSIRIRDAHNDLIKVPVSAFSAVSVMPDGFELVSGVSGASLILLYGDNAQGKIIGFWDSGDENRMESIADALEALGVPWVDCAEHARHHAAPLGSIRTD